MLDIKFVRQNADAVKENIIKKFQHEKLHLVDEVIKLDEEVRAAKTRGDELRSARNTISREIGSFMKQGLKDRERQRLPESARTGNEEEFRVGIGDQAMDEHRLVDVYLPVPSQGRKVVRVCSYRSHRRILYKNFRACANMPSRPASG